MRTLCTWTLTGIGLMLYMHVAVAASPQQSHDSILSSARVFLEQEATTAHNGRFEVTMGRLDNRLKLRECKQALESFLPAGAQVGGRTSVGVRCHDTPEWTIYVTAKVALFDEVLVSNKALPRGAKLSKTDVSLEERDVTTVNYGYLAAPADAHGKLLKRQIRAGTIITPSMLKVPRLVKRGDRVTLVSDTAGIRVRMQGRAHSDGVAGERIQVQALSSKRMVEGIVVSAGVIKVAL